MRSWRTLIAAFALALAPALLGVDAASAQSPLSCDLAPQSVCEDPELATLENDRAALVAQLSTADPQHPALVNEQTWVDGLRACAEDAECYRTAYLNHIQTLQQAAADLPPPPEDAALDVPADTPTPEEQSAIDAMQAERLREAADAAREEAPARIGEDVYVPAGAPGWGFWTMIGVTLLIFWWLMRTLKRNREQIRTEQARLRDAGLR